MNTITLPKILQPFKCNSLIRLGKQGDGGYLVNEIDILKTKQLLSFGIAEDHSFESQFIDLSKCMCDTWDASVTSVDDARITHHSKNVGYGGYNASINTILLSAQQDSFIKCDIEGEEYLLLDSIIKHSHKFTGITMEFHDINSPSNWNLMTSFIAKVQQKLIHTHINNYFYYKKDDLLIPDILELTFTSSQNIMYDESITLPHNLDQSNDPTGVDFVTVF
jgi:hypothetical protein